MLTTYLVTVGIICGIAVILAILMVIADATIGNYGEVKLNINDDEDHQYVVDGGSNLLSTLKAQDIFVPSACGGRGSCGFCKVKIKSDIGEHLATELPWLDDKEMKENVRLSCQIKVKQDLDLEIPEEILNLQEYDTEVESIEDLTHDIKQVTLKLLEPKEIGYKPGQFIQFEVPPYELTPEPVYRAYSMSSDPKDKTRVELEIRLVPNGICTTYVHNFLKEGDKVKINGPYGDFYLRDTDREIIFIAGGSGMAPIKSILLQMKNTNNPRKATYFFGARSKKDLFLEDFMKEMEKELNDFTFIPALSQPQPEDNWEGEKGLITKVIERNLKDGENKEAYLCGSPGMINACIEVLHDKGISDDLIYFDNFG
jgi:Na+-transporting NADH:ubiquinone oxidoreductase subunit F